MLVELLKNNQMAKQFYKLILYHPHSTRFQKLSFLEKKLIDFHRFQLLLQIANAAYEKHYQAYFELFKLNENIRETMKIQNLAQFVVNSIILTGEYNINGLAYYANTTIDIIEDIKRGNLIYPSYYVMNKLLEIFFYVNKQLCEEIWEKLFEQ
ncbi:MAG: hypothetical protein EPO11_10210 [Gammaproteobacteria bacterium]|nr:MAG: hypothetical protein EPO11_10210 [Gammaproteobacteria bacterium]